MHSTVGPMAHKKRRKQEKSLHKLPNNKGDNAQHLDFGIQSKGKGRFNPALDRTIAINSPLIRPNETLLPINMLPDNKHRPFKPAHIKIILLPDFQVCPFPGLGHQETHHRGQAGW